MSDVDALVDELTRAPLTSASSLMRSLAVGSQPTFSRLVARAGDRVLAIGRARARRYAAARDVPGLGRELPLFRVDEAGSLVRVATLRPFAPGGSFVGESASLPRWMQGRRADGTFDGLPPFLADLRPAGFLGRGFAARHASLGLPEDCDGWSDDDVLVALARAGEDGIGDLVLGDDSARRLYDAWGAAPDPIAPSERARAFPALAEATIAGTPPGACVGGEHPKFCATVASGPVAIQTVVKFSSAEYSAAARRGCDLLVCEHLAHEALRSSGFPATESSIVEGGSRFFLQSTRFDRVGARGRRPAVTLAAMNREFVRAAAGHANWIEVAEALARDRWLLPSTVAQIRDLHAFGRFIANTDLHLANLTLVPRDDGAMALAPVYDMLPMGYAPVAGEVPARAYAAPAPDPGHEATWSAAGKRAIGYWQVVARDERISEPFRAIASENARAIESALERFERQTRS